MSGKLLQDQIFLIGTRTEEFVADTIILIGEY